MTDRLRVGTRRSALARAQTDSVLARLHRRNPRVQLEAVPIDASGDTDRTPGGSPDFTDALDRALLRGEIDLAVHSAKDLPLELDPGIDLVACPVRADPRDCLVTSRPHRVGSLPAGARVGSSSLRRRAQLLRWRPDLNVVEIRGNVDTRIGVVRSGAVNAAILAVAGLLRLARESEIGRRLPLRDFLPAPAQGALAVVARTGDGPVAALARALDDPPTHASVTAERAFAAELGGDCNLPLGALAVARGRTLGLVGEVLAPDGRLRLRKSRRGPAASAHSLGQELGRDFLEAGANELLSATR